MQNAPIEINLKLVLDAQTIPAILCNSHAKIVWSNAAACDLLGVSYKQLLNSFLSQWFDHKHVLDEIIAQVAAQPGQAVKLDVDLRSIDQGLSLQAVFTGTEQQNYPVLIELLNHAPALRAQAADHRLQQQTTQRELLRNLAHEIRNPLGGIRGAAQLLAKASTDSSSKEYTDVIVAEASRLQALLDRLLSAQAAPHTRSFINIHEVFERVKSVVSAEYPVGLTWVRDYDVSLPDVWADEHQLVQVFLNLVRNSAQILNALEQTDKTITLTTRAVRQVTIGTQRHKLALELLVIDNGPGIPAHLRPYLFSPLVSGRVGGTGLGLHIAQSFVQQHGGQIEIQSRLGRTQFKVLLPFQSS